MARPYVDVAMRIFRWLIALLIVVPVVLVLGLVIYFNTSSAVTQWQFDRHEVNAKIASVVPPWSHGATWIDLNSVFPATVSLEQLRGQLEDAGHACEVSAEGATKTLSCQAKAGDSTWDCGNQQLVRAEFGEAGTLSAIAAKRLLDCW